MLARTPIRHVALALVVSSCTAAIAACAADGGVDLFTELEGDASATEPEPGVSLPPPSGGDDDDDVVDGGSDAVAPKKKDASADASKDAGAPVWAPAPGEWCPTVDQIIKRTCGLCGSQEAVCLLNLDGGAGGVVSDYNACAGEVVGGCLPGSTTTEPCGNCGTLTRTCNKFCGWQAGSCQNQPVDACTPTLHDYTSAGCVDAGTFRERKCSNACSWIGYSATCRPLDFELAVSSSVGTEVSGIFPLRASLVDKRLTGSCPGGTLSSTTNHPYLYVELVNASDKVVTVSVWNTQATSTGPIIDTLMAAYPGSARPSSDDERRACSKGINDYCPSGAPCGSSDWAGLTGANAVAIPAFGSAVIWFGAYYGVGGGSTVEGDVKLVARTDRVE
ncbi:MAG: hypothetical protein KF764_33945 [Labilithrix sp.]|nr:hypothetical protein [Labilithrix sp.]